MTQILQFTAPWCKACKLMDEILRGIPGVRKIDLEEQPEKSKEFGIMSLPTIIILKNGEVHRRFNGVVPRDDILEALGQRE